MMFAKASILLLYQRLFKPSKVTKWIIHSTLVLVVTYHLAIMFATIFACAPRKKAWDVRWGGGECVKQTRDTPKIVQITIAGAAVNVFTDVMILIIPVPVVWKLQLPRRQKIAVLAIFATGALYECLSPYGFWGKLTLHPSVTAISIARLAVVVTTKTGADITWDIVPNHAFR